MKIITPLIIFVIPVFSSLLPPLLSLPPTYTSYQNEIECRSKVPIQKPKTIDEIQTIVKKASETNTHVKVVGIYKKINKSLNK